MAKLTKRDYFVQVLALAKEYGDDAQVAFIENEIALLDKRAAAKRGKTKAQRENVAVKDAIFGILADNGDFMRAGDIQKAYDGDVAIQKITALLRQMVIAGDVERVENKKVAYFRAL